MNAELTIKAATSRVEELVSYFPELRGKELAIQEIINEYQDERVAALEIYGYFDFLVTKIQNEDNRKKVKSFNISTGKHVDRVNFPLAPEAHEQELPKITPQPRYAFEEEVMVEEEIKKSLFTPFTDPKVTGRGKATYSVEEVDEALGYARELSASGVSSVNSYQYNKLEEKIELAQDSPAKMLAAGYDKDETNKIFSTLLSELKLSIRETQKPTSE